MRFITLSDLDLEKLSPSKLGEILIEAKKTYYTTGQPIMDDHTYDTLETILRQKNPHHRIFQKVGHPDFDTGFDKKKHLMTMGSQNKVSSYPDLVKYFQLKKIPSDSQFVVQPKCDGISLEVVYQNGRFVEAITRGDGEIGDVVSQNVSRMKNFKSQAGDFSGSVRFEIVVTYKDFELLNQENPDEKYSNPRNAASGLTQRLDSLYSQYCTLFAVDISIPKVTEFDQVNHLKQLGFVVVDSWLCQSFQEIEKIYQKFISQNRKTYPFDIDGLVIKINDTQIQQQLGSLNNRPKGQVAYKFPASSDSSRLISIDWQVGPLGTITPVAQIEPVEISGAIITYASLANIDLIEEKGINIGDIVEVSRRGDVIPHIENVISKVTPGHAQPPDTCPECHTRLTRDHKFLRCPNSSCPAQNLGLLRLFCQTLDIKGISEKTISKLVTAGKLQLPGDFYQLTTADISQLDNLGEKSAQNIINQIQAKKVLSVVELFQAAAIPSLSKARIKQLVEAGFDTPQKLRSLTIDQLVSLPGIQITLAEKIFAGLHLRRHWLESILNSVSIRNFELEIKNLAGLTFCLTGPLSQPRSQIESFIEAHGGKIQSAVSTNTSYLITNQTTSDSSKFITAKKLNIPLLTEKDFMLLISSHNS